MCKKIMLSDSQTEEIIQTYISGSIGMKLIGEKYGVSREVIKRILTENNITLDAPGQKNKGGKSAADIRYRKKRVESGIYAKKQKEWYNKNKEHRDNWYKEWREKNREKLREQNRINQKKRIQNDPQYRLAQRFSTAIWQNIKDNGATKYNKTFNLLPYTFEELKTHLESLFEPGMRWDNYGEWHVDHAIPQSKFSYQDTDSEEFKKCWSLENLKPMWGHVNYSKNNRLNRLSLDSVRYLKNTEDIKSIGFKDVILAKEYLSSVISANGKEYVKGYVEDILKVIKKISPELPEIETDENSSDLVRFLDNVNPLNKDGNIVNSRISSYGNMLLKKHFKSYWLSSYKNLKSPKDVWRDDKKMLYILKYRLGLNNSNEYFDITLHQMIKGLSANRYTVSFFKPLLAAYLYKRYLGDMTNPIVFDPCAGFGGRLLGFKTAYPNGTYVACEPNIQTYNELIEFSKNEKYENVFIYNQKFESFVVNFKYDLMLTSIPYFDLETYSNTQVYLDYNDWSTRFLQPLLSLPNAIINLSYEIAKRHDLLKHCDCFLINGSNHFKKELNREPILKLNFIN